MIIIKFVKFVMFVDVGCGIIHIHHYHALFIFMLAKFNNGDIRSIGSGKIIVLFFSAAMLLSVYIKNEWERCQENVFEKILLLKNGKM